MLNWYSLFSHTGKETENLYLMTQGQVCLDKVFTTNTNYGGALPYVFKGTGDSINKKLMMSGVIKPDSIVTLNGYMRILPEEVLNYLHSIGCTVLNIHPAPIQLCPDLRGKDPQERLYDGIQSGKYGFIGVVIHEVDAGVDTGKIVNWELELADPSMSKDKLYEHLHDMGTRLWLETLKEYDNGKSC